MTNSTANENLVDAYNHLVPEGFVLVYTELKTCTFVKKLKSGDAEEIAKVTGLDPKVISSGAKKLADAKTINNFRVEIDAIKNLLSSVGTPLGQNVYMVHKHLMKELNIMEKIEGSVARFESKRAFLFQHYDKIIEAHAQACDINPKLPRGFGDVIRTQHFPLDYLADQLICKVSTDVDMGSLVKQTMMQSLANEADEWSYNIGKSYASGKPPQLATPAVEKLQLMVKKLEAYKMLDARIGYVTKLIQDYLDSITYAISASGKSTKTFDKRSISELIGLLAKLSNPAILESAANEYVETPVVEEVVTPNPTESVDNEPGTKPAAQEESKPLSADDILSMF